MLRCSFFLDLGPFRAYFQKKMYPIPKVWAFIFFCFLSSMCYICGRGLGACKCSWGLPSLLWTIICSHFRSLGLDFLVFSRLRFQDFGANETHPIHTHKPTIFIFHKGCPLQAGGDARSVRISYHSHRSCLKNDTVDRID